MDGFAILLGWLSLGAALLLALAGAWLRKPRFAWFAVVLVLPVAFYIAGSPTYSAIGLVPLSGLVFTALRCRHPARWQSLIGIAIYASFLVWLARVVSTA